MRGKNHNFTARKNVHIILSKNGLVTENSIYPLECETPGRQNKEVFSIRTGSTQKKRFQSRLYVEG